MTLAVEKSRGAERPSKVWSSNELGKLWELAEQLQGRPLPGVRVSEDQFWAEYGDEDIRAEWVDGEVFVMAPASGKHTDLGFWLQRVVAEFVEVHDLGLVRGIEFPTRLTRVRTIRISDIVFISKAKLSRVYPTYLDGPPDIAVEIVSPDSKARDWHDKYREYEISGLPEYWVVDPGLSRFDVYALDRSKKYVQIKPDDEGRIRSKVLKGLYIRPEWLWRSPLPKLSTVLKELKLR
jgi:Uma2 family endonuclease